MRDVEDRQAEIANSGNGTSMCSRGIYEGETVKIREITLQTLPKHVPPKEILYMAIEGTEGTVQTYITDSPTFSSVLQEMLESGTPIVLIPSETQQKRKVLTQYGSFLLMEGKERKRERRKREILFLRSEKGKR